MWLRALLLPLALASLACMPRAGKRPVLPRETLARDLSGAAGSTSTTQPASTQPSPEEDPFIARDAPTSQGATFKEHGFDPAAELAPSADKQSTGAFFRPGTALTTGGALVAYQGNIYLLPLEKPAARGALPKRRAPVGGFRERFHTMEVHSACKKGCVDGLREQGAAREILAPSLSGEERSLAKGARWTERVVRIAAVTSEQVSVYVGLSIQGKTPRNRVECATYSRSRAARLTLSDLMARRDIKDALAVAQSVLAAHNARGFSLSEQSFLFRDGVLSLCATAADDPGSFLEIPIPR